jgi:putative aldouronate transport system permease protein
MSNPAETAKKSSATVISQTADPSESHRVLLPRATERDVELIEKNYWHRRGSEMARDWRLYLMLVPLFFFLICWKYLPIASLVMAFKYVDPNDATNIYGAMDVGLYWFNDLLFGADSGGFWAAFRNTFVLSFYGLCFGFPVPIILAMLFSEIKAVWYRATLQVLTYLPHFVSLVVVTSLISLLLQHSTANGGAGPLAAIFEACGNNVDILHDPSAFRPLYIISGIWSDAGYGSIVYFAAVIGISPTNYEAARIDGATKMQQVKYVTIPGMLSTLVIMLILRIGSLFEIGYEKVILLNTDGKTTNYLTAEIISTYVYHNFMGTNRSSSGGAAADFFNSVLAMLLVIGSNRIAKKTSKTSLY